MMEVTVMTSALFDSIRKNYGPPSVLRGVSLLIQDGEFLTGYGLEDNSAAGASIFSVVSPWNDRFWPLIAVRDQLLMLPLGILAFKNEEGSDGYGLLMAAPTLVVLRLVVVFLAAQKCFVEELTVWGGQVKNFENHLPISEIQRAHHEPDHPTPQFTKSFPGFPGPVGSNILARAVVDQAAVFLCDQRL
ncbi:hypothetical protein [Bradyrhizobium sp. CB3481]|uniref:hypothetical protein n=1 Tax=Bradyrhizobium sp. CB3481 TaxID=3039158 RepID=UPI0024B1B37F|nr:hypothetical protein [Bradyrhizobium sp. CB3481]WFU14920.1 hypothetical protein QA643_28590 [Bradyrhizobium sp. CB3481]